MNRRKYDIELNNSYGQDGSGASEKQEEKDEISFKNPNKILEKLERLQQSVLELQEEKKELQETVESQGQKIDSLEQENEKLKKELIQLKEDRAKADKNLNSRVDRIQQELEDIDKKQGKTKIEDLVETSDEELREEFSASEFRGLKIIEYFGEWCTPTPKGYVLKSSGDWKKKLNKVLTESVGKPVDLDPRQVYRAMEAVENINFVDIVYKERNRKGQTERLLIKKQKR